MYLPEPIESARQIARMMDISAVRAESSDERIREVVEAAIRYDCYLVTMLPAQTPYAKSLLAGREFPKVGGNVGFPSGGQTTRIKALEAQELVEMGVDEIDMVIDVAALISGHSQRVYEDIRAVAQACQGKPLKVILECYYLNEVQIREGCELAIRAGAAYIKTGSGWAPGGATLENVALIKACVGERAKIKASGGIRGIETLLEMYRRGATRFGISCASAARILEAAQKLTYPVRFG